ncbi:thioredoxin family protein [Sulfurimonas sp. HSL-1716]|uniref:thioredoxin family protein n=1 Tax=Hydrocurvibacter sulfurireducens TaxID=3131937 RepID=UPI0031FA2315
MKKIIWSLLFLFSSLFASELHLEKSFKDAVAHAQSAGKPMMFILSRHTCRYCVLLERTTLSDSGVINELNKNFVTYIAYTDDGDYCPEEFWRPGTPTLWFLDDKGEPLSKPIMGAIDAKNLLKALDIIKGRFQKVKKLDKYNYTRNKL